MLELAEVRNVIVARLAAGLSEHFGSATASSATSRMFYDVAWVSHAANKLDTQDQHHLLHSVIERVW